jgi:tripeptidyl-peptidase I
MWKFYLVFSSLLIVNPVCSYARLTKKSVLPSFASKQWIKGDETTADLPIMVDFMLTQSNIDSNIASLVRMSDPESPEYGVYWTPQDVARAFRPAVRDTGAVLQWLEDSGISMSRVTPSFAGSYISVTVTRSEAELLLGTKFHHYTHTHTGTKLVSCQEYYVPDNLLFSVDYISISYLTPDTPADLVIGPKEIRSNERTLSKRQNNTPAQVNCTKYTAPSCLRELYNIPEETPAPHPNNTFGVYEPAYVTWLAEDLDFFFSTFQPSLVNQRPVVQPIDGGFMQTVLKIPPFNLEPNLDFQYAMALVEPQPVVNVQVGDKYLLGTLNNMLAAFDAYYCDSLDPTVDAIFPSTQPGGYNQTTDCGNVRPPQVLSISYSDTEAIFAPEYLRRQCLEYLKLGLMGTTVVVASGDAGVEAGMQPGTCINATTGGSNATGSGLFSPGWPAACPWVTTVGGTQRGAQNSTQKEVALHVQLDETAILTSGGGFSNLFETPWYQLAAVAEYQRQEEQHIAKMPFNRKGRGFPDVAALGSSYLIALYGNMTSVYGTSASAPVVASMIALVNNERMHRGKAPVGFINPVLYQHPEIFNDVVEGSNEGCGFAEAFMATEGWDPVTGLGSPDYRRLLEVFLQLP